LLINQPGVQLITKLKDSKKTGSEAFMENNNKPPDKKKKNDPKLI
jgi:hypothetical protein